MMPKLSIPAEVAIVLEGIAAYAELEGYHGIIGELRESARKLRRFVDEFKRLPVAAVISQGEKMPLTGTITGLAPGASDTFFVTPIDVNGNADALPSGSPVPTFTADDTTVVLAPSADGLSVVATAATGAAVGGSFNLNWAASYTNPAGSVVNITATANIPYLAPPALLPTGGVISQGAPAGAARPSLKR